MTSPPTDPIERSLRLREEADLIIQEVNLYGVLSSYGRIVPTGSYLLNLMMHPDIDVYISQVTVDQMFEIGAQLARVDLVFQIVFEKSRNPQLPGGLYLKARIDYGDWGRPWKIDIWSLEDWIIDRQVEEMHRLERKMTGRLREQILRYKRSVLTAEHRTPTFSGYFIYKAFIDKGLSDFRDVTRYLIENGIRMN